MIEWSRTSGATFEPEKTQFVQFTKKRIAQLEALPKLELMGSEIAPKREAKLLGNILDSMLNFSSHAARAAKRGENATLALTRLRGLRPKTARQLFMATVVPVVDYGTPIWWPTASGTVIQRLQRTTRIGAKAIVPTFKTVSRDVVIAEAALEPTQERLYEHIRRHWIKLHTKLKKHLIWSLVDRLHRIKKHQSPLESTALLFKDLDLHGIQTIAAFTKAPWQKRAEVIIKEREQAKRNTGQRLG